MDNALWYTIIAEISQSEKSPMGQMMVAFVFVYLIGTSIASREQKAKMARRKLPKRIKQVLFLGEKNKFTLYSIIRQSFFMLSTILSVIIMILASDAVKDAVLTAYAMQSGLLILLDTIALIHSYIIEFRKSH